MKRLFLFLAGAVMATLPLTSLVQATNGTWESIPSKAAWHEGAYKVERLSFSREAVGPLSLGNHLIVGEPTASCAPVQTCEAYDTYLLRNGMRTFLGTLPSSVLNEQHYALNGDVLSYVSASDLDETRWSAFTIDLASGEQKTEMKNLFIDGVETMDSMREGGNLYLNPSFNWNGHDGYSQATIYSYDAKNGQKTVSNHYELYREEIQDVQNGVVLSRFVFPSGYKELWVYDTTKDPISGKAIPGTWTPPNEQIEGAHFRSDGSVEYFYLYQRFIYDGTSAKAQGDTLSWYRPASEAIQIRNGRMAWLDPNDILRVSGAGESLNLGTIGYPTVFRLTDDAIFFASGSSGKQYDFVKKISTDYPFAVTDVHGDVIVGLDGLGTVWYENHATGKKLSFGRGATPVLSDENHLYWQTDDGDLFEVTVLPSAGMGLEEARAVQVTGSPIIYLVSDNTLSPIPSEKVYFSWFESWDTVEQISRSEFDTYEMGDQASFLPGSLVRLAGDAKVYLTAEDGSLRWLTTAEIASSLFGDDWSTRVVEITQADLPYLTFGSQILTEQDLEE